MLRLTLNLDVPIDRRIERVPRLELRTLIAISLPFPDVSTQPREFAAEVATAQTQKIDLTTYLSLCSYGLSAKLKRKPQHRYRDPIADS